MKNRENNNCNWEGRKITQTKRSQIKLTPLEVEKNGSACHKQYKNNYEGCGSIVLRDDEVYANLCSALLDRSKGLGGDIFGYIRCCDTYFFILCHFL